MNRMVLSAGACAFLMCMGVTEAVAQVEIGVRAGVTSSSLTGDDLRDTETTVGKMVGGFAQFGVSPVLGVQLGLSFSEKGVEVVDPDGRFTISIDYADVPLLLVASPPVSGAIQPRIFGGPVLSLEASCHVDGSTAGIPLDNPCDDPLFGGDLDTRSVDWGLMLGAGVSFDVRSRVSVYFDFFYDLGLRSIDPKTTDDPNRNRALMVTAGASIQLGR